MGIEPENRNFQLELRGVGVRAGFRVAGLREHGAAMRRVLLSLGLALAPGCTPVDDPAETGGGAPRISQILLLAKSNDTLLKDKNPSTVRVGERVSLRVVVSWTIPSLEEATSAASLVLEPGGVGELLADATFVAKRPGPVLIKAEVRVQRGRTRDAVLPRDSPANSPETVVLSDTMSLTVVTERGAGRHSPPSGLLGDAMPEDPQLEAMSMVDALSRPPDFQLKLDDPVLYSIDQLFREMQVPVRALKLIAGIRPESDVLPGSVEVFGRRRMAADWPLVQGAQAVWISGSPAPLPGVPVVVAGRFADVEGGPAIDAQHVFTDGGRINTTGRTMTIGEYLFFALPGARSVICPVELDSDSVRIVWLDEMAGVVLEGVKPGKTNVTVSTKFRLDEQPELLARFAIDVRESELTASEPSPAISVP